MAKAKKTASKSKSKSEPKAKKTKSVVAAAGTKAKAKKAASGTKRTKVRKQDVGVIAGVPDTSPDEFSTFMSPAPEAGSYSSEAGSYSAASIVPVSSGRAPVSDSVLGELSWNEELRSYHGKIDFRGGTIDISFMVESQPERIDAMLERGRDVVSRLETYAQRAESFATDRLKESECGPSCCGESSQQQHVIADQFNKSLRLKSLEFHASGSVTFLHDDGNAFWGHLIEVTMSPDDQFTVSRLAA
jgi:hypothetical protein